MGAGGGMLLGPYPERDCLDLGGYNYPYCKGAGGKPTLQPTTLYNAGFSTGGPFMPSHPVEC